MATLGALLIRNSERVADAARAGVFTCDRARLVRRAGAAPGAGESRDWFLVDTRGRFALSLASKLLSQALATDVARVHVQTTGRVFVFEQFSAGELVRLLQYTEQWSIVEGRELPWERDVVFSDENLASALEYADDVNDDDPTDAARIKHQLSTKRVAFGMEVPSADTGSTFTAVLRAHGCDWGADAFHFTLQMRTLLWWH